MKDEFEYTMYGLVKIMAESVAGPRFGTIN